MSWDIAKFVELLIVPFFVGIASGAVVVLFGVRSIKDYIRERERKHDIGLLEDFWATSGGSKAFNLVFGGEWSNREGEPEPRFGYAQAYGVSEVIDCLETVFENKAVVRLIVVKRDDTLPAQLFEENLVVFGGEGSISDFGVISRALGLP